MESGYYRPVRKSQTSLSVAVQWTKARNAGSEALSGDIPDLSRHLPQSQDHIPSSGHGPRYGQMQFRALDGIGLLLRVFLSNIPGIGANDIPMIKYAGVGIAMGNASPSVHDAADFVAGDVDDDGLAEAVKRYFPI